MPTPDPRVDTYIANAAPFAQPILREIRRRVHAGCAQAEEAIKWGMPAFLYQGRLLCGMAAFKAHATLGFWPRDGAADAKGEAAMGQYGRLRTLADLPDEAGFASHLARSLQHIASGAPALKRAPRAPLPMPPAFAAALAATQAAKITFDALAPGYQRDYLEWIGEAKRDSTRQQRIDQAIVWLAEGKRRHWQHEQR